MTPRPTPQARLMLARLRMALRDPDRFDNDTHASVCELVEVLAPWVERNAPHELADFFGLDIEPHRHQRASLFNYREPRR